MRDLECTYERVEKSLCVAVIATRFNFRICQVILFHILFLYRFERYLNFLSRFSIHFFDSMYELKLEMSHSFVFSNRVNRFYRRNYALP